MLGAGALLAVIPAVIHWRQGRPKGLPAPWLWPPLLVGVSALATAVGMGLAERPLLAVLALGAAGVIAFVAWCLRWGGAAPLVVGGVAFLTLGLSWYAYVGAGVPGALAYLWDNHVLGRLVTASYRRDPGLWGAVEVYLPMLLAGTLPAGVAA